MYYVYILKSKKNGRLYTGSTNDVQRRLEEHNSGKSKYTKSTRPFTLMHSEEYNTRTEAVQRELFLKTGKGREFISNLLRAVA